MTFNDIFEQIKHDPDNQTHTKAGLDPVYSASAASKIVIVGQAPGKAAQQTHKPWNDISGQNLRKWLDVTDEEFYNENSFALIPMDFYFPGKAKHGDLPPRPDFAPKWHPKLLELMPNVELTILIGQYAQKYYLGERMERNLTETVRSFEQYAPRYFPLVHPSPLTARWQAQNPFFKQTVLPTLQKTVHTILN